MGLTPLTVDFIQGSFLNPKLCFENWFFDSKNKIKKYDALNTNSQVKHKIPKMCYFLLSCKTPLFIQSCSCVFQFERTVLQSNQGKCRTKYYTNEYKKIPGFIILSNLSYKCVKFNVPILFLKKKNKNINKCFGGKIETKTIENKFISNIQFMKYGILFIFHFYIN